MDISGYMPVRLITGQNCVRASAKLLRPLGARALIVTGRHGARACGALDDMTAALTENGQSYSLFDGIGQNPQLADCARAAEQAIGARAEFIVGIGGGSALDAAKCIAVLAANPGLTRERLYALDWAARPLPIVLVGTTAGTGSEVTKVSVLTTPEGRKKSFHHEDIFAALAFGDARYTLSLPETVTRSTAIDVLAHCAESYFAKNANHLSQGYAAAGLRLLLPIFRRLEERGFAALDYEGREALYCASIYGGLAINITGTAFPHNVGYLLTEEYGVPHGTACGVFHEAAYFFNRRTAPELTERFLAELGATEAEYLRLLRFMLPPCDIKLSEEVIGRAHVRWVNNPSIAKYRGELTADMVDAILRERFGER